MKTTVFCCTAALAFATISHSCKAVTNVKTTVSSTRNALVLDRDFVSLQTAFSGGMKGAYSQLFIDRRSLSSGEQTSHAGKMVTRTAALSQAERKQLVKLLNDVHFTKLAGTYNQPGLMDGLNETTTLTLSRGGKTRTYTINNYGHNAPQGYYKILTFLGSLSNKKFPAPK